MTDQEKYQAVINNDANYDGVFFYAVKSTGIFCRPSCKSKIPNAKNLLYFDTAEEAIAAGFRPWQDQRSLRYNSPELLPDTACRPDTGSA